MTKVEGGTYKLSKKQEITVSDFYIGKYEVSIELWEIVTGQKCENLPQYAKNREVDHKREEWGSEGPISYSERLPAYFSQQDILKFIEKLNEITGKQYRLPTENEWLYAAHGGKNSKNYKYSGSNKWKDVARFSENSREAIDREQNDIRKPDQIYHVFVYSYHYVSVLQPVDRYNDPNELGIYLMSGGVWELCTLNGENNKYILRGGGYTDYPLKIDEARKEVSENCGFRLVLDAE